MADNGNGGTFATGFMIGAIVGAVVGILVAPKPGSETRADLLAQSEDLRARAEELAAKVRERIGPTVDIVRERVEPVAERVTSRVRRRVSAAPESDGGPGTEANSGKAGDAGSKEDA
jgi:gas vesicle protein